MNNDEDELPDLFKVLLIGDSLTGKSEILNRFLDKNYNGCLMAGLNFEVKTVSLGTNDKIKLYFIDCAGQEKFKSFNETYYRDSDVVLIIFDVTNQNSFDNIENNYLKSVKKLITNPLMIGLIGNKIDLIKKMVIDDNMLIDKTEKIKKMFPKSKIILRTVSSKTNDGIQELLLDIISMAQMKVKKLFIGKSVDDGFELVSDDVVERLKERKPIKKTNSFFSKFLNFDFYSDNNNK